MPRPQAPPVQVARWRAGDWRDERDQVAAEEPLQLSLDGKPLSIVMRTPGNDLELALGLLWAEQVIRSLGDVIRVRISAEAQEKEPRVAVLSDLVESNQVDVYLRPSAGRRPERSFLSNSACGVCGATTVESLALDFATASASSSASSSPRVAFTRPGFSTNGESSSFSARTSAGTTPSTRSSAGLCSMAAFPSRGRCLR